MDKLILICFCFSLLTSHLQYVSSESETEENERPVLPKDLLDSITQDQQNQNMLPVLSTDNELPKSRNNSNKNDNKEELRLPVLNTYSENNVNESNLNSVVSSKSTHVTSNGKTYSEDKLPPIFIDFESDIEKKSDVNRSSASNTNKNFGLAQPEKPFLPLGNTSAGDETTTDTTNKAGSVSTGKEQFSKIKNIIEQLLIPDSNSEELNKQNNRPELLQKQPYQHDKEFKTEIDRQQQNQFLHINASQKNLSEHIQKLLSKSKPQLLHKKDANKRVIDVSYDDTIGDTLESYTNSNASEGNDQLYFYTKKNGSVQNDSEKVHTSESDQLQKLISPQQASNKQSSFPWSPVDSKHKSFTSNGTTIGEEDDDEEKETYNYITDEGSEEYHSADTFDTDNADSYSKIKAHSDKKNDVNTNEDFAKEDALKNVYEDDSRYQTGISNEDDETDYKTESDKADNEDHLDDMDSIDFNNQVKEDDSKNQTGRSNEEDEMDYKTESDKADSETGKDDLEDIEHVGFNTHSSMDDDSSIEEEEDTVVDSSDRDEAEKISDVDANTAVALYKEAVNSTLLPGSNSKNDQDSERKLVSDNSEEDDDWFYQEKNNDDDDEDYTENEGNKDDSEEYKDEDWDYEIEDDFDESKSHLVDELAKKNKQPTAPTRMVLFYTWMIVAVLLIIVGVSTYQSRCKGFRFFGTKASNPKDDRKRLMEHEFV